MIVSFLSIIKTIAKRKAFYDKYGEDKLKEGFFTNGDMKGGYHFAGNPEEIFEEFFGTNNIFSALLNEDKDNLGTMLGYSFGAQNYQGKTAPKCLEVDVECSLAELYCGCSKKVEFSKVFINGDGVTTSMFNHEKELEIKPGMYEGQKIVFTNEGNEMPGVPSCNFSFVKKNS